MDVELSILGPSSGCAQKLVDGRCQVHSSVALVDLAVRVGLGCRFKANCPHVGSGLKGDVPSVGVFLRHPSPYLCEFRRKPRKTLNSMAQLNNMLLHS